MIYIDMLKPMTDKGGGYMYRYYRYNLPPVGGKSTVRNMIREDLMALFVIVVIMSLSGVFLFGV